MTEKEFERIFNGKDDLENEPNFEECEICGGTFHESDLVDGICEGCV